MTEFNKLEVNPLLSEDKKEKIERIAEYLKQGTLVQNSLRPKLVDVEKRHRKYPLTFPIPSKNKRNRVSPRDFAKVMNNERFHLEIFEVFEEDGKTKYAGVVSNDLQCQGGELDFGDPVIIEPKHILDIKDNSAGVMNPPEKTWKLTHETVNEI